MNRSARLPFDREDTNLSETILTLLQCYIGGVDTDTIEAYLRAVRDEELPSATVLYLILIDDVDHTIERSLILVVDEELLTVTEYGVAHILLTGKEELRLTIRSVRGEVVFLSRRTAPCRQEDILAGLRLTHTAGEADVLLFVDERRLGIRKALGKSLRRAKGLINQGIVDRLAILRPSQRRDARKRKGKVFAALEVTYMKVELCIRTRRIGEVGCKLVIGTHRIAREDVCIISSGKGINIEE